MAMRGLPSLLCTPKCPGATVRLRWNMGSSWFQPLGPPRFRVHCAQIWRFVHHCVDEASAKHGYSCISLVTDMQAKYLLLARNARGMGPGGFQNRHSGQPEGTLGTCARIL